MKSCKQLSKITIACPSNRGIQPRTYQCLLELVAKGGYDFHLIVPSEGYTIAENRNYIAVQAINNGSEYLLMIDDDMTFPSNMLDTLVSNGKDICGVSYHTRCEIGKITKNLDETHHLNLKDNKLFECKATGTGIILIKCDIFKKIERPWFQFDYHDTGQCKLGEDWYFCKKAKKFNIKTFVDPTIKVGHLGENII